jgi:predicted dehydrogenase
MHNLSLAQSEPFIRTAADGETKPLKIVFWGLGSIGTRLAGLIKAHFPHELYAWRHQPNGLNSLGIREIRTDRELEAIAPQVAFISNPTSLHMETALRCAELGMDLFIEKPLGDTLDQAERLIDLIQERELIAFVGCPLRFDPLILELKRSVAPRKVFYTRICCSSYLPDWRPGQDYTRVYSSLKALGGGVLLDLIHELDYAHWLLGDIVRMEGAIGKISPLKIETEDWADLLVHHAGGARSQIHLDYFGPLTQRYLEIFGKDQYLRADLVSRTLLTKTNGCQEVQDFPLETRDILYREQLKYFFDCVDNRTQPMSNIGEHLRVLAPVIQFKEKQGW